MFRIAKGPMLDTMGFATPTAGQYNNIEADNQSSRLRNLPYCMTSQPFDNQQSCAVCPVSDVGICQDWKDPIVHPDPMDFGPGMCQVFQPFLSAANQLINSSDGLIFPKTVRSEPGHSNTWRTQGRELRKHALGALLTGSFEAHRARKRISYTCSTIHSCAFLCQLVWFRLVSNI